MSYPAGIMGSGMKVLLANPPMYNSQMLSRAGRFQSIPYATPIMHPPLLLAYATAYLRSRGHQVSIIDTQVEPLSVGDFVYRVKSFSPDFLVIETTTASFNSDVMVAREVKEALNCRIVFMGAHVSALPSESLKDNGLDAVVVGEYEHSLAEYIEKGPQNTRGVCYRENDGNIVLNPSREFIQDLDALPLPARDLLFNERYFDPILTSPFTFLLGGRGCPYQCTFCNWPQTISGRRYRTRSAKNIVDELEVLDREYGLSCYLFNDDTFTADKKHALSVCDEILSRGLKITWGCYSRADNEDREMLERMREAGCFLLKVGVESGNEAILERSKKGYKLERVVRGIGLMKKLGFSVHGTFVFGLPGETRETIDETIEFAKKLCPTTVQFSTTVPFPGTELFHYMKSEGYLLTEDWDKYMALYPLFEYPGLSYDDLMRGVKKAYRSYYFRPSYLKTGIKEFYRRPGEVWTSFKRLVRFSF